ncbi:hypothetical protein AMS68_004098 [Peltaster fructicola]|uniref:Uncharacterized protein n=1 Tax=Peltaster fructicola TaxID=286661 RepID=A0A6H0XV99_9PEZI|nr:hypothetical protein AMS68_004098 [Peltaster fructicola]
MVDTTNGSDEQQTATASPQPIGISFGNSYSSIAYTTADGKSEVIANEEGDRQIPTILSYVSGEEFVGTQAKAQLVRNPRNTVAYFRDFLGKGFEEVDVTQCHGSAHAVPVEGGKSVGFELVDKAPAEDETPAEKSLLGVGEVAARQFKRLRESASDFLGYDVQSAVVTIPTDFSQQQTAALVAAAKQAGIDVLQTISEPVAALLAHDAKLRLALEDANSAIAADAKQQDQIIVVADLGATRSDIAVFASRGEIYTTLATAHDQEVGGSTLDQALIDYAAKEFLKKHKSAEDPRKNEKSLAKLKLESEAVKKALSIGASANFSIESLSGGYDFSLTVNRTRFELLANKTLASFVSLIQSAIKKADLDILDVDTILLSGGTSHVPKIASLLAASFPETTTIVAPSTSPAAVNPSELAARGAAIQASLIREFEQADIEASTEAVVTVTPHTSKPIGLATKDGFVVIVPADTPVPARRTAQILVAAGGDVFLQLTEGSHEIKVTKEEPAPATKNDDDEDDEDEDDEDDEPEEIREKVYKVGKTLAEIAIKGVKKDGKVEIQLNIGADLAVTAVCREVGGKGGVRGVVQAPSA